MSTRVLRLVNAWRERKSWAGLRAVLTRELFPYWIYRSNEMVVVRLDSQSLRPLSRDLSHIRIRWASPADESLLQQIRPRSASYSEQMNKGAWCVIGEIDGAPASFNFYERGERHVSPANGYSFALGAGAAWAYGMEVAPAFRLSGIFHKHWIEGLALLASRGVRRVYGSVQNDNPLSLNSHKRLGFVPLYRYRIVRVLGLEWFEARPMDDPRLAGARGFGRWTGCDA